MKALLLIQFGVGFPGGFQPGPPRHAEQTLRNRHFLPETHCAETLDLERMQRLKFHGNSSLPDHSPAQEKNSRKTGAIDPEHVLWRGGDGNRSPRAKGVFGYYKEHNLGKPVNYHRPKSNPKKVEINEFGLVYREILAERDCTMTIKFLPLKFLPIAACLLLFAVPGALGVNTWDGGGGNSSWSTGDNWDNNAVPAASQPLTFDGSTRLDPFNDTVSRQVNGFTFAATAGMFAISGNAISLGGNIANLSANTQTIDLDMAFVGSSTRTITHPGGGAVVLDGDISGDGAFSSPNSEVGTITINGNNSYAGGFTYGGGTGTNKTMNLGHANALGTGTFTWNIGNTAISYLDNTSLSSMTIDNEVSLIGAGMMRFVGSDDFTFSGDITNFSGNASNARRIQVDAGTVTFNGNFALEDSDPAVGYNLQFSGPGNLTINGVLNDGAGAAGGVVHVGTGTLTLSNEDNTYTGSTIISNASSGVGVIVVSKLADGDQASSIGASSNAAENLGMGTTSSQGILRYIGSGDSTDRLFSYGASGTTIAIESSGTGALHFTNSAGSTVTNGSNSDLKLGGTYTGGANTMAVLLTQNPGGNLELIKEGPGTWNVTNPNNAYIGATTVNGGTLLISGTGSINTSSSVSVNSSGSKFHYTSSTGLTRNVTLNSGGGFFHSGETNYSGTLTWNNGVLGGTNWIGASLNNLTVNASRLISPGNSPGTASTENQTWGTGGGYLWEINSASGTAGADPGWDLLSLTGTLSITATSGDRFTIYVTSLTIGNTPGAVADFSKFTSYQWKIAEAANTISTFDVDKFEINTTDFSNDFAGGSFSIARGDTAVLGGSDTDLYLVYTAIPEPSAAALFGIGLAFAIWRGRSKPVK